MAAFCSARILRPHQTQLLVERLHTNLLSASAETTARKAVTAILFVDQLELLNTQVRTIKRIRETLVQHPGAVIFLAASPAWASAAAVLAGRLLCRRSLHCLDQPNRVGNRGRARGRGRC